MTVADLASTLAVEATLHHLDLVTGLDAPGPASLTEVRRVVEELLDPAASVTDWSDERVVLVGTGRSAPSRAEHHDLAGAAVPVFT